MVVKKFLLMGVANTIFTYLIYIAALPLFSYRWAYTMSYMLGILFSYYGQSNFVFQSSMSWKKGMLFSLICGVQYLLGILLLFIFVHQLGVHTMIAPWGVLAFTVPVNFLLMRLLLG